MIRPMAVIGAVFVFALIALCTFGAGAVKAAAAIAALGLLSCLFLKKREDKIYSAVSSLALLAAAALFMTHYSFAYLPALELSGKTADISAVVITEPERNKNGNYCYILKTESVGGFEKNIKIRMFQKIAPDFSLDDKISGSVKIFPSDGDSLPTDGIFISGWMSSDAQVNKAEKHSVRYYLNKVRGYLLGNIRAALPSQEGELLCAVLLGETRGVGDEIIADFKASGISHLFAVSGLHLTTWTGIIAGTKRKSAGRQRASVCFSALFVLFFMAITGFSASVVRAGIMSLISFWGSLTGRRADGLNSLGIAAVLICIQNPFAAVNIGFILSFCAAAGILICAEKMTEYVGKSFAPVKNEKLKALLSRLVSPCCVTFSAGLFTLPASLLAFGYVSLVSIPANLLISPAAGAAMFFAGVGGVIPQIKTLEFIIKPIFLAGGVCAKYSIKLCTFFASLPYSGINVSDELAAVLVSAGFICVAVCVLFLTKAFYRPKLAAFSAAVIFLFSFHAALLDVNSFKITVCESGAIVLSSGQTAAVIAVGGDKTAREVSAALSSRGASHVSCAIFPNADEDLISSVSKATKPSEIFLTREFYDDEKSNHNLMTEKSRIYLSDDVTADFSLEKNSSFALVTCGEFTVLISFDEGGDISALDERSRNADILICLKKPPRDYENSRFSYIILSNATEGQMSENYGENVLSTSAGSICLIAEKSGKFTLRRNA